MLLRNCSGAPSVDDHSIEEHVTITHNSTSLSTEHRLLPGSVPAMGVKTLLIDNLDSYTFNLYQLIAEVNQGTNHHHSGCHMLFRWCLTYVTLSAELPVVIRNSDLSLDQVKQLILEKGIHNIVVSPGPGTPAAEADIGKAAASFNSAQHSAPRHNGDITM